MDNRLVLTVLLVTLSWLSVGTAMGNNMTTAAPGNNMTTAAMGNNMTTAAMGNNMTTAAMGNNMTTAAMGNNMTTAAMGNNMTTAAMGNNMTTAAPVGNNMTTAAMGNNMTAAPVGNNMTAAPVGNNMTAAPGNNMTAAPGNNMTTAAPANNMTAAPGNFIVVENLETPFNNTGCGTEQLCAAEPASCNPAVAGSCFFLSARQTSGQNFEFGLAGESDGYIAATLSSDNTVGDNDPTYICANNNGNVVLITALFNNNMLTPTMLNVSNLRGRVDGNRIQCTFDAPAPDSAPATSRSTRTSGVALAISTGPFNSTSGAVGAPVPRLQSPVVNLASPNTTVVNQVSNTTNTTTASPSTNMTAAPGNMTAAPGNMTAAPGNMTAAPGNMTAAPGNMTAAPVIIITAQNLESRFNNTGCGTEQLCAAEPASCNPGDGTASCFFLSARLMSGQTFGFGLSGQSAGYIAATVSTDSTVGGNDPTIVCANNNGTVVVIPALFNNNTLTPTALDVSNVSGRIDGNNIQCTFTFTVPNATVSTRTPNVAVAISTGSFDSTSSVLGVPAVQLQTAVLNLADTNATVVNQVATTAAPTMTTSHAITLQQSLMQAMLIAAGVLGLFML